LIHNIQNRPINFNQCIILAYQLFNEYFVDNINALLKQHPKDKLEKDGTTLFWSGHRKLPSIYKFNPMKFKEHSDFLHSASKLYASSFNIPIDSGGIHEPINHDGNDGNDGNDDDDNDDDNDNGNQWYNLTTSEVVERFLIIKKKYINDDGNMKSTTTNTTATIFAANEEERKEQERIDKLKMIEMLNSSSLWNDLSSKLPDPSIFQNWITTPENFEKDDDSNYHMDFITASSNLRCANYDIRGVDHRVGADRMRTKQIAGRIIPAIATTTAMTTGIVILELFKYLNGHRDVNKFLKWNLNLGINMFNSWSPVPCTTNTFNYKKLSKWDSISISDHYTLQYVIIR